MFERGREAISGKKYRIARNCLTSTLKYIVMQIKRAIERRLGRGGQIAGWEVRWGDLGTRKEEQKKLASVVSNDSAIHCLLVIDWLID